MSEPLTTHAYTPVRVAGVQNGQAVHLLKGRGFSSPKAICGTESTGAWRPVHVANDKTCMACWSIASRDALARVEWATRKVEGGC